MGVATIGRGEVFSRSWACRSCSVVMFEPGYPDCDGCLLWYDMFATSIAHEQCGFGELTEDKVLTFVLCYIKYQTNSEHVCACVWTGATYNCR